MIFTDQNTVYLAVSELIFKTEDGGKTWKIDHYSGKKNSNGNYLRSLYLAKTPNNTVVCYRKCNYEEKISSFNYKSRKNALLQKIIKRFEFTLN